MTEVEALEAAVDEFAAAMKRRLRAKEKAGWTGWGAMTTRGYGHRLLGNAAAGVVNDHKQSLIDAANFAMMMWRNAKR